MCVFFRLLRFLYKGIRSIASSVHLLSHSCVHLPIFLSLSMFPSWWFANMTKGAKKEGEEKEERLDFILLLRRSTHLLS